MQKGFDFNKFERKFFNVTLKDGRVLVVKMPQKRAFEKIAQLEKAGNDNISFSDVDDMCAEFMSNNVKGEHIASEYIAENYDFEEKMAFLSAYMEFVQGAGNNPN